MSSEYQMELTTSAFRVNPAGFLQVNQSNLDRDQPNPSTLTFQASYNLIDYLTL